MQKSLKQVTSRANGDTAPTFQGSAGPNWYVPWLLPRLACDIVLAFKRHHFYE
jgi:hypothetical protein